MYLSINFNIDGSLHTHGSIKGVTSTGFPPKISRVIEQTLNIA